MLSATQPFYLPTGNVCTIYAFHNKNFQNHFRFSWFLTVLSILFGGESMQIKLRYKENQKDADKITAFLSNVSDHFLFHIPLYKIAQSFNIEREEVLNIFIQGVYDGVFILEWIYHCPICGNVAFEAPSLHYASSQNFCTACNKVFDNTLDDNMEVCFSIHPRLKVLDPAFKAQYMAEIGKNIHNGKFRTWEHPYVLRGVDIVQNNLYRTLMSSELLIGGQSLLLKQATVLFTDLNESTRFYLEQGDVKAFMLVKEYIRIFFELIEAYHGVPIKTMGDSIMAVFSNPCEAFEAAVKAQQVLHRHVQTKAEAERLEIKMGLYSGPALLVTLNNRLDYFGLTVNLAAHIHRTARANEIVIPQKLYDDAAIKRSICTVTKTVQKQHIRFKDLSEDYTLYHIKVPSEGTAVLRGAAEFSSSHTMPA